MYTVGVMYNSNVTNTTFNYILFLQYYLTAITISIASRNNQSGIL